MLGDNGFEETFGERSNSTYLSQTLPEEGALLANYFAVASGSLANQIGLLSGQGPTPETALDCPNYGDLLPGTISAEGQAEGNGCVYPAAAETLVSQLGEAKKTWRAYVEGMAAGAAAGQPTACRHPLLGTPDPGQVPLPGDAYETWRNPFVYFHSIVDSPACEEDDVDLERLRPTWRRRRRRRTSPTSSPTPATRAAKPRARKGRRPAPWRPRNSSKPWCRRSSNRPPTKKGAA